MAVRLSMKISFSGQFCESLARTSRVRRLMTPASGSAIWSSTIRPSARLKSLVKMRLELPLSLIGQRLAGANVDSVQLGPLAGFNGLHRLGVRGRQPLWILYDSRGVDAEPRQFGQQIVAMPVVADDGDRRQAANAQGDEIVDHRAERAGRISDAKDLVRLESGLDGKLVLAGREIEVAIEEQIADQGDREVWKSGEQRIQAFESEQRHISLPHALRGLRACHPRSTTAASRAALVQVVHQHFAERTVGVHEHALDVIAMADIGEAGVEAIDGRQIGRAEVVGPR